MAPGQCVPADPRGDLRREPAAPVRAHQRLAQLIGVEFADVPGIALRYDVDLCLQALAAGRLVAVDDIMVRHHQVDGFRGARADAWIRADIAMRRKWDDARRPPGLLWTAAGYSV